MAQLPLTISAVITTYNRAALLRRAIDSVLNQTRPVSELIVVDDGSTDNTRGIVEQYGNHARYMYQDNRGISCARNRGIEEAHSEWVAFLDDDDEWLPEKTEKQITAILARPEAVLCYSGCRHILPSGRVIEAPAPSASKLWPEIRLRHPFATPSIIAKREILLSIGGFRSDLRTAEDWDLAVRLAAGYTVACVEAPLVNVYWSSNSLSKDLTISLAGELSIMDSLLVGLTGTSRYLWRFRALSTMFYRAAISARAATGSGWKYLLRSLLYWPPPTMWPHRYKTLAAEIRDHVIGNG